jgi:hypothetical protein
MAGVRRMNFCEAFTLVAKEIPCCEHKLLSCEICLEDTAKHLGPKIWFGTYTDKDFDKYLFFTDGKK